MVLSLLSSMHVEYDATWPSRLGDEREREQIRAMLDGSIKEPFKQKQHQYVYRVETSVGPAYLKRTTYQSVRSILRHLLRRRCAHTSAGWEYLSTRAVQACGLP